MSEPNTVSASIAVRIWISVKKSKYYTSIILASTNTNILPFVKFQGLSFFLSSPPIFQHESSSLPIYPLFIPDVNRAFYVVWTGWFLNPDVMIHIHKNTHSYIHTYTYIIIYRWIFKRKTCHFKVLPYWSNSLGIIAVEFMTETHNIRN